MQRKPSIQKRRESKLIPKIPIRLMQQEGAVRNEYFMIGKKAKKKEELQEYDEGESGSEFIAPLAELNG